MNFPSYIGNGAYCYADSAAMLLASIGENISPSLIEVLCGIGLSAFYYESKNLLFFNFALPDEELTRALRILGFDCIERIIPKTQPPPLAQLQKDLKLSPVVLGPIDMGYLTYNPDYKFLYGSDHYILFYQFDDQNFYLHDPAKFPCVFLSCKNLENSWLSRNIFYGLENFRYWTLPKRIKNPTDDEIFELAIIDFKSIYTNCEKKSLQNHWITGEKAILKSADRFETHSFKKEEIEHFVYFVLPVGAKRALDFAWFFSKRKPKLSELKTEQAKLFGRCQSLALLEDWKSLATCLKEYADVEQNFRVSLFA